MPKEMKVLENKVASLIKDRITFLEEFISPAFLTNGKWIRAGILMLIAKICSNSDESLSDVVADAALGIELLHAATLLHDDVIDDAVMRRGLPTVRQQHGNKYAILVGDVYIVESLTCLNKCNSLVVIDLACRAARALAEGEIYQLKNIGNTALDWHGYYDVISRKTAVLFAAAAKIGGTLTHAHESLRDIAWEVGFNLGIAFQIMDDIADYFPSKMQSGKNLYKDLEEYKVTLPIIRLLQVASSSERETVMSYFQNKSLDSKSRSIFIGEILSYMKKHEVRDYCLDYVKRYTDIALTNVAKLRSGGNIYIDALQKIANSLVK